MAAKIITVAIEKGGTGKTVTTSNLAYLMGLDGKRVLCIDTDPQGNLTSALSDGRGEIANGAYDGKALYDMFTGFRFTKTQDFITATEYGDNVDMIPGSSQTPRINQRLPELFEDGTKHFLLAHLSRENNTPDIARQTAVCGMQMAGVENAEDYILQVAPIENLTGGAITF